MTLLKWLIAVAAVFGGFVALMYVAQRALMYHPEALRTPPAAAGLFDVQELVLDTADGEKVIVWYMPPRRDLPLVLYFHGNAGSLRNRANRFRALTGDGYGLVVAHAPLALYDAAAIEANLGQLDWVAERASEHELVVEHAMKLGTVVPMKLFTLFSTDERATAHVHRMKKSLGPVVDRIEGCEEWGLRIAFDRRRTTSRPGPSRSGTAAGTASGTAFLRQKRQLEDERRREEIDGTADAQALLDLASREARSVRVRQQPGDDLGTSILVDAVLLVPRRAGKRLVELVRSSARRLVDEGLEVGFSGPWPAYSFIGGPGP